MTTTDRLEALERRVREGFHEDGMTWLIAQLKEAREALEKIVEHKNSFDGVCECPVPASIAVMYLASTKEVADG